MKATGTTRHPSILTLATVALLATPAVQANTDSGWYLAPALNYVIADEDRDADDDLGFQLGLGKRLNDSWNLEGVFEIDTLDFDAGGGKFKQRGGALDGLYFFNRDAAFSPYGLLGAGVLNTKTPAEKGTNPMLNAGVGFLSNVLGDAVALRGEARYRYDGDDSSVSSEDSFGDWIITLGLNIPLGGSDAPAPVAAPAAAPVAEAPAPALAPAPAPAPADSDGDGVTDDNDACPDSPAGARVDARGCEPDSDGDGVVDSADRCPDSAAGAKVDIHGCEIKAIIELPGVNFETGSARLLPESTAILDEAAATLRKHPEIRAEVAGHTDSSGSRAFNVKLSQQRAESVMNYLVGQGVAAGNLTAQGYGPDRPEADNATAAGRAANRRVELKIVQ
ncbi:MAG: OmpA family protein [Gammaproteobacteria bacterium]